MHGISVHELEPIYLRSLVQMPAHELDVVCIRNDLSTVESHFFCESFISKLIIIVFTDQKYD